MTRQITIQKFLAVSILLEMCLPYCDEAGESEQITTQLDLVSQANFEYMYQSNEQANVLQLEDIGSEYVELYRAEFGEVEGQNAKDLLTICIGSIWRNMKGMDALTYKYLRPVVDRLKSRTTTGQSLGKYKAEFAKQVNLSINKASKMLIKEVVL